VNPHTEIQKSDPTNVQPPLSEGIEPDISSISLRMAQSDEEIKDAQKLRYKIFYEEFGVVPPPQIAAEQRDYDEYDDYADHLVVIDDTQSNSHTKIVGTYRLFRAERLPAGLPFYSSQEFHIDDLITSKAKLLELGRSCVLPAYRTKYVMQRLWQGIAEYLSDHNIDLMFGCASFQGTDPAAIADQLAYLHYYHAPPENLCPVAIKDCTQGLVFKPKEELDAKRIFSELPPLIKGYLRVGAYIGKGAYLDNDLNCIDVCVMMPTHKVAAKYLKHYERKIQKDVVRESEFSKNFANLQTPS
jgi:putative hemolysin